MYRSSYEKYPSKTVSNYACVSIIKPMVFSIIGQGNCNAMFVINALSSGSLNQFC